MATWSETLNNIQKLRELRRRADNNLYAAQLELAKTEINLKKIRNQETTTPTNPAEIELLRKQIAELEKRLEELNKEIAGILSLFEKINEVKEKINFIEKNIQLLMIEIEELNQQLSRERDNGRPDRNKIVALEKRLDEVSRLLKELRTTLGNLKRKLEQLEQQQRQADLRKQELEQERKRLLDQIKGLQNKLNEKLRGNGTSIDEEERKRNELEEKKRRARRDLDAAINNLNLAIKDIYVDPHPRSVVGNLNDGIPFLLLPVRIETRFMTTRNPAELWVRIYPDDIAIHTHEKTLTEKEVTGGNNYWASIFEIEKSNATDKEQPKKNAWSILVSSFSAQRAAWVASQTKPSNWDNLPNISNASQLMFPVHPQPKPFEWSRAPRTNILPDKFVVMCYQGDSIVKEQIGNLVPDELYTGPDPLEPEEAFKEATDDNTIGPGTIYDWVSNFDRAVENGMGFKIPLNADEATRGFSKLLVLGVYSSAQETESKSAVETLIDNHHYSPKGFSMVRQGTATNNTEQDGSGFSKTDPFDAISFFVETGKPLFDKEIDCDGRNLANALGIEYDPLQFIHNSDSKDLKEAIAMNTALYPSTLGYYFSTMMKPVMNNANQDKLRDFFIKHVSGRGPLPAIRIGNQPYGILLTSDFSKWQWKQNETIFGNTFLNTLYKTLDHYHNVWKSLLDQLLYTGKPGADPSEVLMNILGLQSGSVSFFQRNAFSTEQLANRAEFEYGGKYYKDLQNSFTSKITLLDFLRDLGFEPPVINGKRDIPQLLRLVYQHYHTALDPANVIEKFPLSEDKPLHTYTANKNYIHWLLETNSVQQLERQDFGQDITPPSSLLYMQLRRSLLLAMADASVNWFKKNNIDVGHVMAPANFHNIRPQRDLTKWEVMKGKISNALPAHPQKDKAIAEHLLTTGKDEDEAGFLMKIKESLALLAGVHTARLERCFAEHIDTCTYRLDAWQTALFDYRLKKQRQINDIGEQPNRNKGIYLGAYGWIEDLRPSNKRQVAGDTIPGPLKPPDNKPVHEYLDNGGFVHAPSINQATAAAVLRSGYLSHASSNNPDVFAVNLSSERIRRATFVLEGLRNGQSLEVLLGFQFERGLHDRASANDDLKRLNEYIYNFRDTFTIKQHHVKQQGVVNTTTETIVTKNVVNGLELAEIKDAYPYNVVLDFTNVSLAHRDLIKAAIIEEKDKLEDTLDAIKDLFLSESIYQMVQGNFDRAAAMTTTLRDATVPPAIDVIETPSPSHLSFTNRVTIQFDTAESFDGTSPRAKIEPGINKWLKKVIGDPGDLVCDVTHDEDEPEPISMADINLQPIDLVYIVGNDLIDEQEQAAASELETRIAFYYRNKKAIDDDITIHLTFTDIANNGNKKALGPILPLIKTLKQVITDSRPLTAQDFDSPSKPGLIDKENPNGYLLTELEQRIMNARDEYDDYFNLIRGFAITKSGGVDVMLGEIFDDLDKNGKDFTDIEFSFTIENAIDLQNKLIHIAGYGLADSFPQIRDVTVVSQVIILLEQARNTARKMFGLLTATNNLINSLSAPENNDTSRKISILIEAGKTLFGAAFTILPRFMYNNPADITASDQDRNQLLSYATNHINMNFVADEWMQQTSTVRPRLARWDHVRTIYEIDNADQLELAPVQLPFKANDSWLAVEFPKENPDGSAFNITNDTLSIVIHGEWGFSTAAAQCGLLVDDWTELVPEREATTGVTFNYNQPDAMPPQALLLAVTPEEKGNWSWDELVGILNDTLLRAKLRAVEPRLLDKLKTPDIGVLLPAIISTFSQQDLDISLDYRNNVAFYENNIPLTVIG